MTPKKKNREMIDVPRQTALNVLNQLSQTEHHHLDRLMTDLVDRADITLSHRDRNFLNVLIFGVLRWRGNLDWTIRHYSRTPLEKINPDILNILRLGLYQIFFLDRVPDSAAVNTSVELAKIAAPEWIVKFVNALLRNAIRNRDTLPVPSIKDHPVAALSVSKSFPEWLIRRWLTRFGLDACEKLCDAFNEIPPITIRCNTLKVTRPELMQLLAPFTDTLSETSHAPDGLSFAGPSKPVHELPAFQNGMFQVQDEAAQLITCLLDLRPDEFILDACAGLGGKTGHIAQCMRNTGRIVAADQDPKKLAQLSNTMKLLGATCVTTKVYDFETPLKKFPHAGFDRILLDAPCSGLGVIRRNPDIKWDVSRKDLTKYAKKQSLLLENVSALVKPGGTIVYVVCSFEPEETESVVDGFLKTHPDFEIQKNFPDASFDWSMFTDQPGFFRTFPHVHRMDGFFAAVLKRV